MIELRRARAKTVRGIWYQGKAGAGLPRINATGAVFSVLAHSLAAAPTIAPVNLAQGEYDLIFGAACTAGLSPGKVCTVTVALDFPAGPSPDAVDIPVTVL
jgi:hypothetical protein